MVLILRVLTFHFKSEKLHVSKDEQNLGYSAIKFEKIIRN